MNDGHIYEVSYIFKKGEDPKVTHVLAKDEDEAAEKIKTKYKASYIVEVFKI